MTEMLFPLAITKSRLLIRRKNSRKGWTVGTTGGSEPNAPQGKFSKRTVNLVGSLDKSDATLFSQLCCFMFLIGFPTALIFDLNHKIYNDVGITFDAVSHLESAGLIHLGAVGGCERRNLGEKGFVSYFDTPVWIEFPPERKAPNTLPVAAIQLSKSAHSCPAICRDRAVTAAKN
jgi:hypothetical protein